MKALLTNKPNCQLWYCLLQPTSLASSVCGGLKKTTSSLMLSTSRSNPRENLKLVIIFLSNQKQLFEFLNVGVIVTISGQYYKFH